jgi:CheY-like chemotaxis protein
VTRIQPGLSLNRTPFAGSALGVTALPPILLVDDEPDDLFILRRLIAKAGIRNKVVAMEDPLTAIDYLDLEAKNGRPLFIPCVVVLDLNMPGKNGFELTHWIRSHPKLHDTRVIMITDSDNPVDEERANQAGVTHFMQKFPTVHGIGSVLADLPCAPHPE